MSGRTVLAIELSTSRGQIAVMRDGMLLHESEFVSERSHNSLLFRPLGEALEAAGGPLSLIVVGTGPGSYTGVRIAIAAAQGVAFSRNALVIGLPSVAAAEAGEGLPGFSFIGDARRGQFYAAKVSEGKMTGELRLLGSSELAGWLASSGESKCFTFDQTVIRSRTTAAGGPCDVILTRPSARLLALQSMRLADSEMEKLSGGIIEPLYVSEAFITTPKRPWLAVGSPS